MNNISKKLIGIIICIILVITIGFIVIKRIKLLDKKEEVKIKQDTSFLSYSKTPQQEIIGIPKFTQALVYSNIDFSNGKFIPSNLIIKFGTQVNFSNKSNKEIDLISGIIGCSIKLKPKQSFGCLYKEKGDYIFKDKITGEKGKITVK